MFFTDVFHRCWGEVNKINGKVENYGEKRGTKIREDDDIYRSLVEQKAGITLSILNWIVEKPLLPHAVDVFHNAENDIRLRKSL